jgi:hypothetical protein
LITLPCELEIDTVIACLYFKCPDIAAAIPASFNKPARTGEITEREKTCKSI